VEVTVEIDGRQQRDADVANEFRQLGPIARVGLKFCVRHETTLPGPMTQGRKTIAAVPGAQRATAAP
jgi:hypothetical protein